MNPGTSHRTSQKTLTRRTFLAAAMGVAVAPSALAQPSGPPHFGTARNQFTLIRPRRPAGQLQLSALDGGVTSLQRYAGKVIVLNFWATWCPPCRVELPILERLQQALGPAGLQAAAVSVDDGEGRNVERFVRELKIRQVAIFHDRAGKIARSPRRGDPDAPFALYGMPITYVIGRSGHVEGYLVGEADWMSPGGRNLLEHYLRASPA
jgi:thiol-disulfide isomerase/thioredoxin